MMAPTPVNSAPPTATGYLFDQGQPLANFGGKLADAGVYLKGFKVNPSLRPPVSAAQVNSIGMAEAAPSVSRTPHQVDIVVHDDVDPNSASLKAELAAAAHVSPDTLTVSKRKIRLNVQEKFLNDVAAIDEVRHIEEVHSVKLYNNIARDIIADATRRGCRAVFLTHRRELTRQASVKLFSVGIDHGIVQAGFPTRPAEKVQVASIQTLHARAMRSSAMELPEADLVVVDRDLLACPVSEIAGTRALSTFLDGRRVFERRD